jgi:hypothetical protein
VADTQDFIDIVSGGSGHYLALTSGGSVYVWGKNSRGQLGLGHTRDVVVPVLLQKFNDLDKVVRLAAGHAFSVALTKSGDVYVWGDGADGQCCSMQSQVVPRFLKALQAVNVVDICAGHSFVAARSDDGRVYTWGSGLVRRRQTEPTLVEVPSESAPGRKGRTKAAVVVDFAAGFGHMLLVTHKHAVYSWGLGIYGQLGLGEDVRSDEGKVLEKNTVKQQPTRIDLFDDVLGSRTPACVVNVYCGSFYSACVMDSGEVYTFGHNANARIGHQVGANEESLHVFVPRMIEALEEKSVTQLGCGKEFMTCFVKTHITNTSDSCISAAGGTEIAIWGHGIYDVGGPVAMKFHFDEKDYVVEGFFDEETESIISRTPVLVEPVPEEGDGGHNNNNQQESRRPAYNEEGRKKILGMCSVSISLDGYRFTSALPVHVFRQPSLASSMPLVPAWDTFEGGVTVSMSANFDSIPYSSIRVCFLRTDLPDIEENKEARLNYVDASYDSATGTVNFVSPKIPKPQDADKVLCHVHISLDGQTYFNLHHEFMYYHVAAQGEPKPSTLTFDGARVLMTCSGVYFTDNVNVRFHINGSTDADRTFTLPASPVTARELGLTVFTQLDTNQSHSVNLLQVCSWVNELGVLSSLAGCSAEELVKLTGRPGDSMLERGDCEAVLSSLMQRDAHNKTSRSVANSTVTLAMDTPSFTDFGPCAVHLSVSLNGVAYTPIATKLLVRGPELTRITPSCGPSSGGTRVEIHGKLFYNSRNIAVKMFPSQPEEPIAEQSPSEPSKKESSSGKDTSRSRPSSRKSKKGDESSSSSSKKDRKSARESARGEVKAEPVATEPLKPILVNAHFVPLGLHPGRPLAYEPPSDEQVRDWVRETATDIKIPSHVNYMSPLVPMQTSSQAYTLSLSMNPLEYAFQNSSLQFTYYSDPKVTEVVPPSGPNCGGEELYLYGKGLIPSDCIVIRLSLSPDDVEALKERERKERLKTEKEASDRRRRERESKEKANKKNRGKKSKKGDKKEPEPEPAAAVEEPLMAEEPIEYETIFLTIPGVFHTGDEEETKKKQKDKKHKKRAKKDEGSDGSCISFVIPPAAAFGHYGADAQCSVSIELALNGQQFVKTSKNYRYDKKEKGRSEKEKKDKRKSTREV